MVSLNEVKSVNSINGKMWNKKQLQRGKYRDTSTIENWQQLWYSENPFNFSSKSLRCSNWQLTMTVCSQWRQRKLKKCENSLKITKKSETLFCLSIQNEGKKCEKKTNHDGDDNNNEEIEKYFSFFFLDLFYFYFNVVSLLLFELIAHLSQLTHKWCST